MWLMHVNVTFISWIELWGSLEWRFRLVCTGIWSIGVVHIYLGIKLVERSYFQYLEQACYPVFKMLVLWFRDPFLGTTTRMLFHLAVRFPFLIAFIFLEYLWKWNYYNCISSVYGLKFQLYSDRSYYCFLSSAFGRFFCLVGLEKMGKGNWLDGSARH